MSTLLEFPHKDADALSRALRKEQARADFLSRELEDEMAYSTHLEALVDQYETRAACFDLLTRTPSLQMHLIAVKYGMNADALYKLLHSLGIVYKAGDSWLLYQKYAGEGYTHDTVYHISPFTAVTHTQWTRKGQAFLYRALKDHGILPLSGQSDSDRE